MSPKLKSEIKLQIKYDRLNTKYNRLVEQCSNILLFIFASFLAYSILFIEYKAERISIFFINDMVLSLVVILMFPIILLTLFGAFLVVVKKELNRFLIKYEIFD